jgi:mono/diheme cytochrome c family protein
MTRGGTHASLAGAALLALCTAGVAGEPAAPAYPAGLAAFQANCAVCHGPAGAGVPSLAPPLLSYPARYAASDEGRRQLAITVLYGLVGDIVVEGHHYDFAMPSFAQLDDATLAAALNFVVFDLDHAPDKVRPIAAAELAAERAHPLESAAVREHRKSVAPAEP